MAQTRSPIWKVLITLFFPIQFVFDRVKALWIKLVIVGPILLVPFIVAAYLARKDTSHQYVFNQYESWGVDDIQPMSEFLYALERHRVYAVANALNGGYKAELAQASADADTWMAKSDTVNKTSTSFGSFEKIFKLNIEAHQGQNDTWPAAKAAWEKAKAMQPGSSSTLDIDAANAAAMNDVAGVIQNQPGQFSNLILDPDLDSYWLMDAFLYKYADLGSHSTELAASTLLPPHGQDPNTGKDVQNERDRSFEVAGWVASILAELSAAEGVDFTIAFREVVNYSKSTTFVSNLKPHLTASRTSLDALTDLIKAEYLGVDKPLIDINKTTDETAKTLAVIHDFYTATAPELRFMTQKRADTYSGTNAKTFVLYFLASILMIYILFGSLISLQEQQRKASEETTELQANIVDLLGVVSDASEGVLTVRAKMSTGALGNVADALNQLLESFSQVVGDILGQINRTKDTVESISASSRKMAAGATSQARDVFTARQLVDRMSQKILSVAENANTAAQAAKRTEDSALAGAEAVQNVINGMDSLRANVQAGAKKMKNLGDRSMEITGIVSTINRISEQTNMLALNAAIEAARAGEHGRGFSVVADEVRKLAERTAAATLEIDKLVKTIHVETNETINAIEQQTQVVEHESEVVGTAGDSLSKIREASTQSADLVADISTVAKQQAESTREVVRTMEEISGIAQQTQAGAESTAATVSDLLAQSERLRQSVARFKLGNGA